MGLIIALRYPAVQTFIAQKFTAILSKSLNTKVSIDRVEIEFFNKADLVNFYLEDHNHDTLISARELKVNFKVFELLKKEIVVSKVLLNGAVVHLHKGYDGQLNITELFKSFASTKAKEDTVKAKTKFTWNMDLKDLELLNTDFRFWDERAGTDVRVGVPSLAVALKDFSMDTKLADIATAKLKGVQVAIELFPRPKRPGPDDTMYVHFMLGGLKVKFDEFELTDTRFKLTNHSNDTILKRGMDFRHLDVKDINLFAENGTIDADSIITKVTHLSAKERSGFELLNLTTQARVSTNDITLSKLTLTTPNSEIKNYLSFRFNVYRDFKDFVNAMRLKADFTDTKLSLKDLGYFVKGMEKVEHNTFTITGELDGRVNNLKGRGLEIRGGNNTVFKGDFYTRGLPNIYETSLNVRVKRLSTTMDDVRRFYPGLKLPPNVNNLGLLYYSGSLDGFVTDFVSNGKLVTSIGSATTDVNFKYDKKHNKASYKGALALNNFDLGKYFNNEVNLGKVSLNGKINGGGLTLESLYANLEANIDSITLKDYKYKDIQVNGYVVRKSFNGLLQIHDDNLDLDFNGRADLSKQTPEFNFDADVRWAKLKKLNLTKEDFAISGQVKSDFKGARVDDVVGNIDLKNVLIRRDTLSALVKYLKLNAKLLAEQKKEIVLNSDFAEAEMSGNFTITELPSALLEFAKYTFTKDYVDTNHVNAQNFSADVRIYEPGNLTRILYPQFYMIRNSHVLIDFNSNDHKLNVEANIPQLKIAGYDARRIDVNSSFTKGNIDFKTTVDKVYGVDSVMMDTVAIVTKTMDNKDIRFDVLVADKRRFNYANITAFLTPQKGQAVIRLEPSDVKLANYNWHFLPDNEIIVEGKKITSRNLVFKTFDQTIFISSYLKNDTSTSLKLVLDNTDISDFTGIFTQKMKDMSGAMNGKLIVEDLFYKPKVFANLVINEFKLGPEMIGDIDLESTLDETGKSIKVYASVKGPANYIEAKGAISLDPTKQGLDIDVDARHLSLNFLNYKFFEKYVKNCRGYATAKINVHGNLKKPLLKGEVWLVNDTVTVSFLNTTFHVKNQKVTVDEHGFDVGTLTIHDVNNDPLYGTGRINHESFRQFALDLKVTTPRAQFLNTTAKESPNFYGEAYGEGNVTFWGPISTLLISAYAKTLPGTWCKLPINSSFETNKYSFYKFSNGKEEQSTARPPQLKLNGVNFKLKVDATEDARMDIILNPSTGDILTAYGHGPLKIEIPRVGSMTIDGDYEIDRGNYLFTLQSVVNKRFELSKGGVIHFTGDVYKAGLNVNATYDVRASVSDLFLPSELESNSLLASSARNRVPVKLFMNLTGILEKPNIAFSIQAYDVDPTIRSYVDQKLNLLKLNESDLNKQVFGLLVMNRFLPNGSTTDALGKGNYAGATAANTVSEFLSSQLSNYLGNLLDYSGNDALRNLDINIGYRQYDQSNLSPTVVGTNSLDTRRELQLALQQRLLNNRLTINAGGNIDFGNSTNTDPNTGAGSRSVIPTGDFQIQYSLTPDGRWSAKAFNRTNYDYYNSRNTNRTGVGISYRREFDTPRELFTNPNKKKKKADKKKKAAPANKEDNVEVPPVGQK